MEINEALMTYGHAQSTDPNFGETVGQVRRLPVEVVFVAAGFRRPVDLKKYFRIFFGGRGRYSQSYAPRQGEEFANIEWIFRNLKKQVFGKEGNIQYIWEAECKTCHGDG